MNLFEIRNVYNDMIVEKTNFYQKKYNFEINSDPKHKFWNVEADAFKHAFLSADLALRSNNFLGWLIGNWHESETPKDRLNEKNMDLWNNYQGREIAKEIKNEYGKSLKNLHQSTIDDIIADKIMQRMRKGELITHPSDKRKFTGFAANIEETEKSNCAGTYPVSGYVRKDGTEVSSYTRTCGAKHQGKTKIPPLHTLPKEEMEEWIKKLI